MGCSSRELREAKVLLRGLTVINKEKREYDSYASDFPSFSVTWT